MTETKEDRDAPTQVTIRGQGIFCKMQVDCEQDKKLVAELIALSERRAAANRTETDD